jgi:hypothetical protein
MQDIVALFGAMGSKVRNVSNEMSTTARGFLKGMGATVQSMLGFVKNLLSQDRAGPEDGTRQTKLENCCSSNPLASSSNIANCAFLHEFRTANSLNPVRLPDCLRGPSQFMPIDFDLSLARALSISTPRARCLEDVVTFRMELSHAEGHDANDGGRSAAPKGA